MTPNTTAIMTSVGPQRRGIANGVRSTCQNTGYALSTALMLALATYSLSPAEKRAAYQGELSTLGAAALPRFTAAVHAALLVLAALAVIAVVISYGRGQPADAKDPATTSLSSACQTKMLDSQAVRRNRIG